MVELIDYGEVRIKTDHIQDIIEKKNISKNKICQYAMMERTQLNRILNGNIQRMDFSVMARLCCVLKIDINDLLEYVPPADRDIMNA